MFHERETLFEGSRFNVVAVEYDSDQGTQRREIIRHPGAVTIIPMVDHDHVCLIRQQRPAVAEMLIELPAGTLEPGEPPQTTAGRELIEETGYRAAQLELLSEFFMSPGILDERMYVYLATGLTEGPTAREPSEQIDNYVVPWSEAMQLAQEGAIQDAKTLLALFQYDRRRQAGRDSNSGP